MVAEGKLSPGHARALLASNATLLKWTKIAALIIEKGWSVRETERWAKGRAKSPRTPKIQDPNEAAAADRLRIILGTKVEILAKSKNSGEIRIHYYSQEDLMRSVHNPDRNRPFQRSLDMQFKKRKAADEIISLLGKGAELTGEISFTNGLRVEGTIKGKVRSEATLEIGPGGIVDAEVNIRKISINGEFRGVIHASDRVEIRKNGKVFGRYFFPVPDH